MNGDDCDRPRDASATDRPRDADGDTDSVAPDGGYAGGVADGLPEPGSLAGTSTDSPATATGGTRLRDRVLGNPRPAAVWAAVGAVLLVPELGALAGFLAALLPVGALADPLAAVPGGGVLVGVGEAATELPTLLSRETIPNQGYRVPGEGWQRTFLGLSPMAAWLCRVGLILAYSLAVLAWLWAGYRGYRRRYRRADWSPLDDSVDRFRRHRWGQFGLLVVALFLVLAVFAPAISPTTAERNIQEPYSHELSYYDEGSGTVETVYVGDANLQTISQGTAKRNVGPLTYDRFGRFHPFGTLPSGRDLFTFMAAGARVSLFIGLLSIGVSTALAASAALASGYFRGRVDLAVVLLGDSIQAMPQLLVIILVSVAFSGTWLAGLYDGGVLIALVFALTGWPALWRAIRGPALQVSTEAWVEAARGFGQAPTATMRKHMLPYITGYMLVYASMILGGVIIGVAGLSFLGLGVSSPTPEWGRAINAGEPYLATRSWHISLIPGLMIVLVVTGFNALGDGIRDAIDPQSDAEGAEAAVAGGGGA